MRVLMIRRAERFSPNAVERDRAILTTVGQLLAAQGHEVTETPEEQLPSDCEAELILTMGREPATLLWLKGLGGMRIINSPDGVTTCTRSTMAALMERLGTPRPPAEGTDGYWLKRGDAAAQTADDIQFAATREELDEKIGAFRRRGVSHYVVSAHVRGDLVKFYGVRGTDFFHCCYPTDDGITKFGDEARNGQARHYPFDRESLWREATRIAAAAGVEVYGGDCIVRSDGSYCIIDFNDWPSFSRCREEAAAAIAALAVK